MEIISKGPGFEKEVKPIQNSQAVYRVQPGLKVVKLKVTACFSTFYQSTLVSAPIEVS